MSGRGLARQSTPLPALVDAGVDPGRRWWFEVALTRCRWGAVALTFLLIPLFPAVPWPPLALLALGLALGNATIARQLRAGFCPARLRRVQRLATGLSWSAAAGAIALFSGEPVAATPALLMIVMLTTAIRYGLRGVVAGALAAGLIVALLVTAQAEVLHVLRPRQAYVRLVTWEIFLAALALVLAFLIRAGADWRHWERARAEAARAAELAELAVCRREHRGLSAREWEVLRLLADERLTYRQIAGRLDPPVAERTVKTHVERIEQKLAITGGRRAVVRQARSLGLLPPDGSPSPDAAPTGDNPLTPWT